jgi:chorismate dehydratase
MIRISLVDYLNAAPLGWSFLHGPHKGKAEVVAASPARCADQLASGEVDVGLIPSIEFQRIPGLRIIPDVAIAASSRVRSVILVRRSSGPIKDVALDDSSRTSAALTRLLMWRKQGIRPEFVPHRPVLPDILERCDAALVIGDAALRVSPERYRFLDLAEEWIGWQKRPFVFAFWACRPDVELPPESAAMFQEAKAWGMKRRHEIAHAFAARLCLPEPFLRDYLFENIEYELSSSHLEGLRTFYELAYEEGLTPGLIPARVLT